MKNIELQKKNLIVVRKNILICILTFHVVRVIKNCANAIGKIKSWDLKFLCHLEDKCYDQDAFDI